jgi:tetratricopeptide (TPR) repeat protein
MGTNRAIWIVALAAASLAGPVCAQKRTRPSTPPATAETTSDALQEAEDLLQKQQYDQAETRLKALVSQYSSNSQAWFDLGYAESHLNKNSEAIAAYRKAAELTPKWFEANVNLALALTKSGQNAEAASALKAAVQLKPSTGGQQALANAWLLLAQVQEDTDAKSALAAYENTIELSPTDPEQHYAVGRLLERDGDLKGAEQHYLKSAELGKSAATGQLIDLYIKQKRFADAESLLRKYSAQNPNSVTAQVALGRLLAAQGKTTEAIASLEAANVAADPTIARELAGLYLEGKQYDKAVALFRSMVDKNPNDADIHLGLGTALVRQHNYTLAESELIKALQLKPSLTDAYFDLAFAAQQNKHYELAIRVLDARAKLQPEMAGTYWIRAVSYDNLRAYKLAAESYKLFLAASGGKSPDQEFQARHRLIAIEPK